MPRAETSAQSADELTPYQLKPPEWRPLLHPGSRHLGIPDFFPPRSGQPEDVISEATVRSGLTGKPVVASETFSAHNLIYDRLKCDTLLPQLGTFLEEVLERRQELQRESVAPFQCRIPPRVTLNDLKLGAYIRDLADPAVPLSRLARSVPHGYRGDKMLDMLWSGGAPAGSNSAYFNSAVATTSSANAERKSVEIPRAVWFIRVVGASEIQSARARPLNANYTVEWTAIFTTWLRRQLSELTIPSSASSASTASVASQSTTPTLGSRAQFVSARGSGLSSRTASAQYIANALTSAKETDSMLEPDARRKWCAKWAYSLSLARNLLSQSLLDHRSFLQWTLDTLAASNLAQLAFTIALVEEHTEEYVSSAAFVRSLVQSSVVKLAELDKSPAQDYLTTSKRQLGRLLRNTFDAVPEGFVSPRIWIGYSHFLSMFLLWEKPQATAGPAWIRHQNFAELKRRNEALLLVESDDLCTHSSATMELHDVELLDSIGPSTDLAAAHQSYFHAQSDSPEARRPSLGRKIDVLLTWASSSSRHGSHRSYVAGTFLQLLQQRHRHQMSKSLISRKRPLDPKSRQNGFRPQSVDVQSHLMRWLSDIDAASSTSLSTARDLDPAQQQHREALLTVDSTCLIETIGELVRRGVFSYAKYLQRLTARGITAPATSPTLNGHGAADHQEKVKSNTSIHMKLVRSLPVYEQSSSLLHQRRVAIYGLRSKESWEEATERRALRELHALLPWLAGEPEENAPPPTSDDNVANCLPHLQAGSCYIKTRIMRLHLLPAVKQIGSGLTRTQFVVSARIMALANDFASLSELMMHLLRISATTAITEAVLETMVEHANVWSSMQVLQPMADLILAQLHHANSAQSPVAQHASASLVRALVAMGAVPAKAAESLSHSARRSSWPGSPSPPQGAEVHNALASLMADTEASEPHLVSAELLKRHGPSKALIDAAWAAVTTSLRSRPEDDCSRYVELLAYLCVDCSSTFNKPFQDWASAATREGVDAQDNSISQAHIQLIVGLTMKGLLASNVVLESLLLPHMSRIAAKGALSADESKSERDHWPTIAALINALLLARPSGGLQLSVVEQHSLRAQRAILFQKHSFSLVVRLLAMLATIDVTSQPVVAQLQPDPNEVRAALCDMTLVKVAAQKDPAGFARSLDEGTSVTGLAGQTTAIDRIFQALDADSLLARPCLEIQCAKVTSRLDPWRTRWTMVEMRYIVDSLQAVPPSQLVRADAKLAALAECLFEPLLGDGNASLMSDLLPTGTSNALVSKLAAAGLTQVLETLTQTSTPRSIGEIAREDERIGKLLRALIRILKRTENYVLPAVSGDTAERVLLCVVERFEGAQRGSVDGAELFPSLRLLHLLLRFEGLWTHTAKTLAGRLQNVLIKLATGYGHDCEDEATFVALIDTVAYIQDELPADAKASAAAMLNPILNSTPNTSASPEPGQLLALPLPQPNVVRLQRLLPYVTQNPFVRDLVMADSARAAILHGQCSPAPDKPWEWLDHLDSPSTQTQGGRCDSVAATATATATASSSSVQASASASAPAVPSSGNAIVPLQNVGSLSLSSFAAQKTRDRVPSPEIEIPQIPASPSTDDRPVADSRTAWRFLESERTYGDWMGGEPIYARDMRRGFVDTSAYAYVLESGSHHSDEEQQQQQSLETNTDMNTNASTNTRKGKSQDRDSKEKLNAAADNKLIDLTGEDDREQPAAAPPAQPAAGSSSSSSRKRKDPPAGAAFAAAKKAASKPKARRKKTG